MGALLAVPASLFAQANLLDGKKVGVYISAKAVTYGDVYYLPIAQFVTQDDEAAWNGKLKSEFLIRMGWMLTEQLQGLSLADTVYFMNADLPLGSSMQEAYDPIEERLTKVTPSMSELDFVLILDQFSLQTRNHRSVYIRSNRMVTENIPIRVVDGRLTLFDLRNPDLILHTSVCYDEQTSAAPPEYHFDFHNRDSAMGGFLGKVFSTWWELMLNGERSNCQQE